MIFWLLSGIWLSCVLYKLTECVLSRLLHRQLSPEHQAAGFTVCLFLCVICALLIGMLFSKKYDRYKADRSAGYDAKPFRLILKEILLYLLLNGGAGVLMFFLLHREDLHRFQN